MLEIKVMKIHNGPDAGKYEWKIREVGRSAMAKSVKPLADRLHANRSARRMAKLLAGIDIKMVSESGRILKGSTSHRIQSGIDALSGMGIQVVKKTA